MRSDAQPQKKLVASCAKAKEDAIVPTYSPTWPALTSGNVDAICGRYGPMLFRAVCSDRDMTASTHSCLTGRGVALF